MAIAIKNKAQDSTFIQTTTKASGAPMPTVFFVGNSFNFVSRPNWVRNESFQREGTFAHYAGSRDRTGTATLILYGIDRYTNLEILRNIKEAVYLDATDYDSNLNGNYTMTISTTTENIVAQFIEVRLDFEGYNN